MKYKRIMTFMTVPHPYWLYEDDDRVNHSMSMTAFKVLFA